MKRLTARFLVIAVPSTLLLATEALSAPTASLREAEPAPAFEANLRIQREALTPFRASADGIRSTATAGSVEYDPVAMSGRWTVEIDLSMEAGDSAVEVVNLNDDSPVLARANGDSRLWDLSVSAPAYCDSARERTSFHRVGVRYMRDGQARFTALAVDHRCLLGNLYRAGARDLEGVAREESVRADELAVAVTSARADTTTEASESALVDVVRQLQPRFVDDPVPQRGDPFLPTMTYALSVDDTLRYGGDCEDWAIVAQAVLSRLHVEASIEIANNHVSNRIAQPGGSRSFDLTRALHL